MADEGPRPPAPDAAAERVRPAAAFYSFRADRKSFITAAAVTSPVGLLV